MAADAPDRMGRTPLHYAALEGPGDQVRALIAAGANVAATDKQGFTALHFACQQDRVEVVELLLAAGAPIDAVDAWGNTPLFRAVFNSKGDPSIVRRLVKAGADPITRRRQAGRPESWPGSSATTTPPATLSRRGGSGRKQYQRPTPPQIARTSSALSGHRG